MVCNTYVATSYIFYYLSYIFFNLNVILFYFFFYIKFDLPADFKLLFLFKFTKLKDYFYFCLYLLVITYYLHFEPFGFLS